MKIINTTMTTKTRAAIFCCVLLLINIGQAQVQQNATLYVGDTGVVSVFSAPFNFGAAPSSTVTTRTSTVYGKVYFPAGVLASNPTDAHQVNGYVSSFGNADFTFPIGNGTLYAPASIRGASTTSTYDSAYYSANPTTVGTTIDSNTLLAISTTEFWDFQSAASATLSLSWRSASALGSQFSGATVNDIVIAGWDGAQWTAISSVVDATNFSTGVSSDLTAGSISSDVPVDFTTYSKFTFGRKENCDPLVASNGIVKTWNGSAWSPAGAPTLANPVVIDGAYNAGTFACNSLELNADVTLGANEYVEIVNGATGSGKVVMATSASVVQRANGVSAPTVSMTKVAEAMTRWDYIYFGTPVAGNFFSSFATAQATGAPAANAFDSFYRYRTGFTGTGSAWELTSTTTTGRGLIARVKQADPFLDGTTTANLSLVIDGVANNGDVTLSATNNPARPNGGTSHILLGNPYPSAISGDEFLEANTDLDGALYVWNSSTTYSGTGLYNQADYLVYTKAGFVAPNPITTTFNGIIPSGQAFKVKILPDANPATARTANVTFTNCMRVTGDNSIFYKNASLHADAPKDRYKVTMTGANGVFSQILVAYLPEATLGYDRMYDAGINSASSAQLYSVFENDGRRLSINARPSFVNTDKVPVGIRKRGVTSETFTFSLTSMEGVFTDPNTHVYLHDKTTGVYHDLTASDFNFTTSSSTVNDRFELVYQTGTLSSVDVASPEVSAYLTNNVLSVNSSDVMKSIQVFDLAGRLLHTYSAVNAAAFSTAFNYAESVYIVKVTSESGHVSSIKLIHNKN